MRDKTMSDTLAQYPVGSSEGRKTRLLLNNATAHTTQRIHVYLIFLHVTFIFSQSSRGSSGCYGNLFGNFFETCSSVVRKRKIMSSFATHHHSCLWYLSYNSLLSLPPTVTECLKENYRSCRHPFPQFPVPASFSPIFTFAIAQGQNSHVSFRWPFHEGT